MIFMTTRACVVFIGNDVLEVSNIPERRQDELLAEFERKKKVTG